MRGQVPAYRLGHVLHQFLRACAADPPDLVEHLPGDRGRGAGQRYRGHVGDRHPSPWMHPAANHPCSPDAQPGLLERFPHRGVLRRLARLNLPAREHPRRVPVPAPADQDTQITGNDRNGYCGPPGRGVRAHRPAVPRTLPAMPPIIDWQFLLRLQPRPASAAGAGSIWAIDVPAWITAIATFGLLVGAAFTAIYAIRAFRKQSQEVADQATMLQVQQYQLEEQRKINAEQTGVLKLQADELRESLAERKT